ncbi:response regulator [Inquilinus sp. NPDC058860]|uniref:response regulator n=1 Tax=Inquilinus sp. NPDC058860 TaxID=3346652 RepID=UPI0036B21E9D
MESSRPARILIVEDEWTIASMIASIVTGAGCDVVGPTGSLGTALALATSEPITAALLDIELGPGIQTYPVAKALKDRGIPFAFVSSRAPDQIDRAYAGYRLVPKPFQDEELVQVLADLVRISGPAAG